MGTLHLNVFSPSALRSDRPTYTLTSICACVLFFALFSAPRGYHLACVNKSGRSVGGLRVNVTPGHREGHWNWNGNGVILLSRVHGLVAAK